MTPSAKAQLVKALALDVGFDLAGVVLPKPVERAGYYRGWLAAGYGGTMGYLARNVQLRMTPAQLVPGTRSIICVALNYKRADGYLGAMGLRSEAESPGVPAGMGLVAQYARGRDYHSVMRELWDLLIGRLRSELREPFEIRVFVDTGPVLERELAVAAGLGWFGRNTCLLNGSLGSYLFLAEAFTTLEIAPDEAVEPRCGRCRRCMDACPTRALIGPGQLDASRCISYLTIENRGMIADEFIPAIGARVFGCDACQQVCPYNARAPRATQTIVIADAVARHVNLLKTIDMQSSEHRLLVRGTAAARAARRMWRRNAAIALSNDAIAAGAAFGVLRCLAEDPDPIVRATARACLRRLSRNRSEAQ